MKIKTEEECIYRQAGPEKDQPDSQGCLLYLANEQQSVTVHDPDDALIPMTPASRALFHCFSKAVCFPLRQPSHITLR